MKWFRLYYEAIDDEKLRLLAFEDRWHYIAILCLKSAGLVDLPKGDLKDRKIALKLGLTIPESHEVRRRLVEVGLIEKDWQPCNWEKRQYIEGRGMPGDERYNGKGYVYFIGTGTGLVKIGYSKNPWARLKDFQTATTELLRVITTARTTEASEANIHDLFRSSRKTGEWFNPTNEILKVINALQAKEIKSAKDIINYVEKLRSSDVPTTTDTDTDTDTEREKGKRFSPPTQGLVFDYMLSQGMSKSEAKTQSNKFVNFYQSKAWLVGKTKMKDWEAAVRNNWLEKGPKEERRPYEISGPPDCPKCRRTMFKNHTCEAA